MRIRPEDILIEAAAAAHRDRDPEGRIQPSADRVDLAPEDRDRLFEIQLASRILERAAQPDSLSATARAVLEQIRLLDQFPPEDPSASRGSAWEARVGSQGPILSIVERARFGSGHLLEAGVGRCPMGDSREMAEGRRGDL
jgi:hypothetical protein